MIYTYSIHELTEYINWSYFFHAWQLGAKFASIANLHGCDACRAGWLAAYPEDERSKAAEAMQLYKEANRMLDHLDKEYHIKGMTELFETNSDGDDLLIFISNTKNPFRFPLLRQQGPNKEGICLCLSDFIRPISQGIRDRIGLFATAADPTMEHLYENDPYRRLLVQTLSDRLAEAAAERMHQQVRRNQWGYAPEEKLSIKELLVERYDGTRPAVGYPSLPDQSVIFLIDELIALDRIGIRLTENGAMQPHASVCGIMISHPGSQYFSIGKISNEQLIDYAQRRNKTTDEIRRFLTTNL